MICLKSKPHQIYSREGKIATRDRSLLTKTVGIYTGSTTHRSHLITPTLWVISIPFIVLVIGSVKENEVREEPLGGHPTRQFK